MTQVKVTGLRELGEALRALPEAVASRSGGPMAGALRAASKVFAAATVENIQRLPVSDVDQRDDYIRSGALARSIVVRRDRNYPRGERFVVTNRARATKTKDNSTNAAWYAGLVEFGTEKMPARPYMRPAYESTKVRALDAFKTSLAKGIDRAARKAARKGLIRGR